MADQIDKMASLVAAAAVTKSPAKRAIKDVNEVGDTTTTGAKKTIDATSCPCPCPCNEHRANDAHSSLVTPPASDKSDCGGRDRENNTPGKNESITVEDQVVENTMNSDGRAQRPLSNIVEPGPNDRLFGRGGGTNHHPGNKLYRQMVDDKKSKYLSSKQFDKPLVAMEVVHEWRALDPPGRFLKQDDDTKLWTDVGDERARKKTSQALRDILKTPTKSRDSDENEKTENFQPGTSSPRTSTKPSLSTFDVATKLSNDAKSGINIQNAVGGIEITSIVPGSIFDGKGLGEGMRIESINGRRFATCGPCADFLKTVVGQVAVAVSTFPSHDGDLEATLQAAEDSVVECIRNDDAVAPSTRPDAKDSLPTGRRHVKHSTLARDHSLGETHLGGEADDKMASLVAAAEAIKSPAKRVLKDMNGVGVSPIAGASKKLKTVDTTASTNDAHTSPEIYKMATPAMAAVATKRALKGVNEVGGTKICSRTEKKKWTKEEDNIIVEEVNRGTKWCEIAMRLPGRIGDQVKDRWTNALDPDVKRGVWTEAEMKTLREAQNDLGNKWTDIAKRIPGRTETSVKNRWHNQKTTDRREAKKREELAAQALMAAHGAVAAKKQKTVDTTASTKAVLRPINIQLLPLL